MNFKRRSESKTRSISKNSSKKKTNFEMDTVNVLFSDMKKNRKINSNNIQIIGLRSGRVESKEEMLNALGGADKKLLPSGKLYMDVLFSNARISVMLPYHKWSEHKSLEELIAQYFVHYTCNFKGSILGFSICFIPFINGTFDRAKAFGRIYAVVD